MADPEYHYGLMNRDTSAKPSMLAYATAAQVLDRATFVRWLELADPDLKGLLFSTPEVGQPSTHGSGAANHVEPAEQDGTEGARRRELGERARLHRPGTTADGPRRQGQGPAGRRPAHLLRPDVGP